MIKGIDRNSNPESTSSDYISWAKNAINSEKLDSEINEQGTIITTDLSSLNILFKNGIVTLGNYIIQFYKNLSNRDCIAVINETTNTVIEKINRDDLEFDVNYPITGRAKFNPRGELVVAFVSGNTSPKYINLDTADPADSLNFYSLFPDSFNPSKMATELLDSGNLTTGCLFFSVQYISKDRTRGDWSFLSNPVYITPINPNLTYYETKGTNTGLGSNKSVRLTLSDVDQTYSKLAIAVVSKINGVISAKIVKEVGITESTVSIVYNGTEFLSDVLLEELITPNVKYNRAKHITVVNDQVFLADLTTDEITDFQHIANQTIINWVSYFDNVDTLVNSSKYKDGNNKTFAHDEVYAFYVQFELLNGNFTKAFHIPGPALIAGDLVTAASVTNSGGLTIGGQSPKVYQVEDTSTYVGPLGDGSRTGAIGKWENVNEIYPANFPDFAGQNVRHHKFPSIQFMNEVVWTDKGGYGINNLDRLSITVANNAIDTTKIKGYRVLYAKRNLSDVGVIGQGIVQFAGTPQSGDLSVLLTSAGNFNLSCNDGVDDDVNINKGYLRFNSFDLFQDRPDVTNVYLRNYIKLKADNLAKAAQKSSVYGQIHPGSGDFDLVAYACNFSIVGANNVTKSVIPAGHKLRKLSEQSYIPNNISFAANSKIINNSLAEETMLAKIEGVTLDIATYGLLKTETNNSDDDQDMAEETMLSALKTPKSDYFVDYENQVLIPMPEIIREFTTTKSLVNYGDHFICLYSWVALAPYNPNQAPDDLSKGVKNFKIHVCVCRHNANLRYIKEGDYSSYFFPDGGLFTIDFNQVGNYWFYQHTQNLPWNKFLYSKDFSSVNDLENVATFNRDIPGETDFSFRIARSTKANRENALEDGWKTFKPLDYFDTVRNKGPIINLESLGNTALIIHHAHALFRTIDQVVLKSDIKNITLGSGDIFELDPSEENATSYGYAGTQHKFSCLMSEIGYAFMDAEVGRVYLYNGQQIADISKGFRLFFKQYVEAGIKDNPFNDQGITMAFDQKHTRLLLSHKGTNTFTVSFDLIKKEWQSAHDYVPDFMFNTRTNLYSYKQNILHVHNKGKRGEFYGTTYPFYVDYIVNDESKLQKVLSALQWTSKYKNADGSVNQRKTITHITVWNDQHCTNKIDVLTNETDSLFVDANAKIVDESWSFDDLTNKVINPALPFLSDLLADQRPIAGNFETPAWWDSEPLRGKFFIVRLEYSNTENKEVNLRELIPQVRKSKN